MQNSFFAPRGVVSWGLVAVALSLVAIATLVPRSHGTGGGSMSFWCLACGDYALADALANVALFVPLGWAISRTRMRPRVSLAVVLTTTIGVELLQYGFVSGRVASMSDILTNTVGGVAGMALPYLRRSVAASDGRALLGATLYGVLLVAGLGVSEATQAVPLPRRLRWTAGSTAGYVPFTGSLGTVRVYGTPVTMHQWLNLPPREGVEITVDFLSGRPDTGVAQVIVAWMPSGSGWMWLEQQNRDLRVHLASASDGARLRGHSVWLNATMPAMAGEPVTVRLVVRPFSYRIVVRTKAGDVVRDASITPGDGWRLFTPSERWGERWAPWLRAGWMAVLLGPLGYLAAARSRVTAVVAAVGAGVSLVLLPIVSGCAWLRLPGWCGAASGFLIGSLTRTRGQGTGASATERPDVSRR